MRRQSKPFVTEYRSSNRRAKPTAGFTEGRDPDNESTRVAWPPADEDDGLTAALAAADALFAGSGATSSKQRAAAPADAHANDVPQGRQGSEAGRGRILQAIEASAPADATVQDVADATRERADPDAPRRRGRKPGSKRQLSRPEPSTVVEPHLEFDDGEISAEDLDALPLQTAPAAPDVAHSIARAALLPSHALSTMGTRQRRSGERYSWVRTKLRPGERWKRRLPKVAW